MTRFKNFKVTALNTATTVKQIISQREIKTEIKETTSQSMAVLESLSPQLPAVAGPSRIRTRKQNIRFYRSDSVENKLKSDQADQANHWKNRYEKVLEYQPKVLVKCLNMTSSDRKLPRQSPSTPELELPQVPVLKLEECTPSTSALTPFVQIHELNPSFPSGTAVDSLKNPDLYCSECKITIAANTSFSEHVRQVHLNKTDTDHWTCKVCKKVFPVVGSVVRHYNIHRYYETVKKCDKCHLVFTRYLQYKRHYCATNHTIINHICEYCKATFIQRQQWVNHVIKNHPENVQCLVCGEVLEDKTAYFQHIYQKHPADMTTKMQNYQAELVHGKNFVLLQNFLDMNGGPRFNSNAELLLSDDELQTMSIPLLESYT